MDSPTHTPSAPPLGAMDRDLLAAWSGSKDEGAFHALVERHVGMVRAACARLGATDADEATQAVFMLLSERAELLSGQDGVVGWLLQAARRVVANQRRMAERRKRHEKEAAMSLVQQRAGGVPAEWADARGMLDEALASLTPARREAVVRFYLQQRPQAEIAAELGCSAEAVRTRVHEGMERLRRFFVRRGMPLGVVAIAAGLASEASAAEPALITSCLHAAAAPASAPGAAALAHATLKGAFVVKCLLAGGAVLLAGSAGIGAMMVWGGASPATPETAEASASTVPMAAPTVVPTSDPGVETAVAATPQVADAPTLYACRLSSPTCRPGETISVTYIWDAAPMDMEYWTFVHIRQPDARIVAQDDHVVPLGTMQWKGHVVYTREILIPADAVPGDYSIVSGLWLMLDGKDSKQRLHTGPGVVDNDERYYQIGTIKVIAP